VRAGKLWLEMTQRVRRIKSDPERRAYRDVALTPVTEHDTETLALFTHNDSARHAVDHARKVAALTGGEPRASHAAEAPLVPEPAGREVSPV
jgi:hypothetical protein